MLQFSKSDIKTQIYINLDYAQHIDDGIARTEAMRLVMMYASQLTQEERKQIAENHIVARTLL